MTVGQDLLVIDKITHDGTIMWSNPMTGPEVFHVEFKSHMNDGWASQWNNLVWKSEEISPSEKFEAHIPMYFRLKRYNLSSSLPLPISDSDFYDNGTPDAAKIDLGRMLFFDKELSGNRNISCATCHHPLAGTGDLLSLSIGEGGSGLGPERNTGLGNEAVLERVPRNAPDIFNRGAREFTSLFHDGRVEVSEDHHQGIRSPAGTLLPPGLDNVLAAQAMFPVTSATEMAGQSGENSVADLVAKNDFIGVWNALSLRLQSIPEYVNLFILVFDDIQTSNDIKFVHAANAIAAFEAASWRFDNAPFDKFLRGEPAALSAIQKKGMILFYGKAKCASCHSGPFLTDHAFHAVGIPQIGPGKGDGFSGYEDFGRERVSNNPEDRYLFRTPSLRNVTLTGPWGHDGAFRDLKQMVLHKLNPRESLLSYSKDQAVLPSRSDLDETDFKVMDNPDLISNLLNSNELETIDLTNLEIEQLIAFLHSLTDPRALNITRDIPVRLPSVRSILE